MKKYSAVISRDDGDYFVQVDVIREKEVGIFKKRKVYLVSYVDTTYYLDGSKIVNNKAIWVRDIYVTDGLEKK